MATLAKGRNAEQATVGTPTVRPLSFNCLHSRRCHIVLNGVVQEGRETQPGATLRQSFVVVVVVAVRPLSAVNTSN